MYLINGVSQSALLGLYIHYLLKFRNSTRAHSVFVCFMWISGQKKQ